MKKNRFVSALAILGALIVAACPVLAQPVLFHNDNFGVGNGPGQVIQVDVNGDGHMDVVCVDFGFRFGGAFGTGGGSGTTLSVLTNDGTGVLGPFAYTLNVGKEPAGVAAADVNGDGSPDLISANVGDNTVTVLTNDGKGGFTTSGTFSVGNSPTFVAAADVNGDGSMDLITVNYGGDTMTVLTNNGHGIFKLSSTLVVGPAPNNVAVADINGDGSVDLVCANSGNGTLQTFTNNGKGLFTLTGTIPTAIGGASWVAAGDVDRDGTVDLVVASGGITLGVFTNDGSGHFGAHSTATDATIGNGSGMVVLADMNGDGRVDMVCPVNGNGIQGGTAVLTNDGYGNFIGNSTAEIGLQGSVNYPNFVVAADFNGDGNNDIATSCYGTALITELTQTNVTPRPGVMITSPADDAVFGPADIISFSAAATTPRNIAVVLYYLGTNVVASSTNAPFNAQIPAAAFLLGSHALQAAAFDVQGNVGWSAEISVNISSKEPPPPPKSGPLTFSKVTVAAGNGPSFVLPVDLNGDGNVDLAVPDYGYALGCVGSYAGATGTNVTLLFNDGRGVFSTRKTITIGSFGAGLNPEPEAVAAADFDGDGKVELVEANFYFNTILLLTNNGKGMFTFANSVTGGARGPVYMTTADVNKDGKPDLITVNHYDANITVLTNAGNFVFSNSATLHTPHAPAWVTAADLDGDGNLDLVTADYGNCGDGNELSLFLGDGRGGFVAGATLTVGSGPLCVVAADVNGDGKIDLISANQYQSTLTVLTNDGHGNFTLKATISIPIPQCIVAADLTGTGRIDLACVNAGSGGLGAVTVLTNNGRGDFSINTVLQSGPQNPTFYPDRIAAADFNRDGKMDLAVANYQGGSVTIFTQTTGGKQPPPPPPPAAPTVSISAPVNGQSYGNNQAIVVSTVTGVSVAEVDLYVDGQLYGKTTGAPFSFQLPAGTLSLGGHSLQAVALNSASVSTNTPVIYFTINAPGTTLIDFDALNTSSGAVSGTALANYLGGFGVALDNVTVGTTLEAINTNSLTGNVQASIPSSPNFFTQAGQGQPVSFTLRFASPLLSFGFTRAGVTATSGLASHPHWTATAYDANGVALGSVTEALIVSSSAVPQRSFLLTGNGIASVRFDSDSQQAAAFTGVLLDNLVLNNNAVASQLSVGLTVTSPPTNDIVAPATITLQATVNDELSSAYYVSFFAGTSLLGTVGASPYRLTISGVLAGQYNLQAQVVDATGQAAESRLVPITVQVQPGSKVVNFDALIATHAPIEGGALAKYLAGYGVSVGAVSPGTQLAVENQQNLSGGKSADTSSPPNVLTQIGSNGPMQFTLKFSPLLSQFGFTRPGLLANPFVSHPAWQVTALDGAGVVVGQVEEGQIDSATNMGAREFSLSAIAGTPGIASVVFNSQGTGLTTFKGMLVDDLVLTTNKNGFPPAVAITRPITGQALAAPPALIVSAAASDAAGIAGVGFYANGALIGSATKSPYSIIWTNPPVGPHPLKAVATNLLGQIWTSPLVRIVIQPSAYQFGFSSQPASQTIAAGGSVTFSVMTTGTNGVGYQWSHNGVPIPGATGSSLVLLPPVEDANAGTYTVAATSGGVTINSSPAMLTVVDPPVFTAQPLPKTVLYGANVTMRANATGSGAVTWQWLLNGTPIPGATDRIYTISSAQPLQSGNYQVVAASMGASAVSSVAGLMVTTPVVIPGTNDNFANRASIDPLAGPVSGNNNLATIEPGEPLPDGLVGGKSIWFTWHASFTGTISLTTEGSDFDTLLAVYTGTKLTALKPVAADDDSGGYLGSQVTFNVTKGTDYQIDVDGYQGSSGRVVLGLPAGTGYRILNPSTASSPPVITRSPVSRTVAPNSTASFTVQASSPNGFTCQWNYQGAPITGATETTLVINHVGPGSVGLYDVVVANSAGTARSEQVSLQIGLVQGVALSSTQNKLPGFGDSLSPKMMAFELHPLAVGGDTRGFSVAQTFSTVGATLEPGQPEPCGQIGGASQWFVYTAPATGMLQINTAGSSFNTMVGVYTGSGDTFASLVEVGCGYTTNFMADGQPEIVLPDVAQGTRFYILVDGFQGASGVVRLQIGLGQPPTIRSLPASQIVTAGGAATFNVSAVGSTPFTYQWQLNGVNIPGATKASCKISGAQESAVGNYTVIVSNVVGAVTSSPPAALHVQYAPAILSGPSSETVKLGQPAHFLVTALGVNVKTNPFVSQWYFDGDPVPRATGLGLSIPVTRLTNAGTYDIVISNKYGSVTSTPAMLTIVQPAGTPGPGNKQILDSAEGELFYSAAGTYSGIFQPAGGATQASSGFFTATVSRKDAGTFSANLLLDGGSYPFTGNFDSHGDAQSVVQRAMKAPVSVMLHVDVGLPGGRMTGSLSSGGWRSILEAGRAAVGPSPAGASQVALVAPNGDNAPIGFLTLSNIAGASSLVTGAMADGAGIIRTAPMVRGAGVPLYAPLYSGKGLFVGWITLTNRPGETNAEGGYWIRPGATNKTAVVIVK